MTWLFFQTLIWLLLAFLLGLFLGWVLRGILCRGKGQASGEASIDSGASTAAVSTAAASLTPMAETPEAEAEVIITDDMRPMSLSAPNGQADDLKRISGVGPVIEKTLNELGIYHFTQVADFSRDNISWVDNYISFPGRIDRETWVSQASDLAKGVKTEFASRYDRGEVGDDNPNG